jgi:hypothetical protein
MERFAFFVDAGYLYVAGGDLCCGERKRGGVDLDASGFVSAMLGEFALDCDLPPLRTYWYDGAKRRVPTASHQQIAAIPNVKLRLGSISGKNQQKGVDALIYRDLITLARARSIAHAYLLSGDEDLREGVQYAQELGVRVTLVGIPPVSQPYNQSLDLVNEADELLALDKAKLGSFFTKRTPPPAKAAVKKVAGAVASTTTPVAPAPTAADATKIGAKFAEAWWAKASEPQRSALLVDRPRIPGTLDTELLRHVEQQLGVSLRQNQVCRKAGRQGFWAEIRSRASN